MVAVVVAVVLTISPTASASPCDTAQRGTYLSNVCWLVHDFSRGALLERPIVAVNENECTVDIKGNHRIFFARSDGNLMVYEFGDYMCWQLTGEGITRTRDHSFNTVEICGKPYEKRRIERAMENLFSKYCPVEEPEF